MTARVPVRFTRDALSRGVWKSAGAGAAPREFKWKFFGKRGRLPSQHAPTSMPETLNSSNEGYATSSITFVHFSASRE
jgi:hypothetical protein